MELIKQIDETVSFDEKNIRVIGSYEEPWFVAKDICNILELPNITNALKILPEKWRGLKLLSTFGGEQNMNIINEAGLYKLIMRSNKPISQKFQEVVCEEILPSLRKKGEFKLQELIDKNKELEEEKLKLEEDKNKLETEKNLQIKKLENKVLRKQKRTVYNDKNVIYIVQDEYHKKDRIYIIGKSVDLAQRLSDYNKARDYEVIYYRSCNSTQQMSHIEKCVLAKLDIYREVSNRDRFILAENTDLSVFTNTIDLFVDAFSDIDHSVNIDIDTRETHKEYYEDHKEDLFETAKIYRDEHKDELFVKRHEYNENNKEALKIYEEQYKKQNEEQIKFFNKMYTEKNKEKIQEYQKEYRNNNKNALNDLCKEYYDNHKDEHNAITKEYKTDHKEELTEYNKQYYIDNKEDFQKYKKDYYESNKQSVIEKSKNYYKKKKEKILKKTKKH